MYLLSRVNFARLLSGILSVDLRPVASAWCQVSSTAQGEAWLARYTLEDGQSVCAACVVHGPWQHATCAHQAEHALTTSWQLASSSSGLP
jgi:hypothetical protein